MTAKEVLLEVDSRRRVSLGKGLGARPGDRFLGTVDEDGVITLTPAVVLPAKAAR